MTMLKEVLRLTGIALSRTLEIAGSKKAMRLYWAVLSALMAVSAFSEPSQAQSQLSASFALCSVPLLLAPDFVA